jgi:hypothetical protein
MDMFVQRTIRRSHNRTFTPRVSYPRMLDSKGPRIPLAPQVSIFLGIQEFLTDSFPNFPYYACSDPRQTSINSHIVTPNCCHRGSTTNQPYYLVDYMLQTQAYDINSKLGQGKLRVCSDGHHVRTVVATYISVSFREGSCGFWAMRREGLAWLVIC